MRLKNHTDIPTDEVRAMIRMVRPGGIANFDVRVSNLSGRGCCGRAYTRGSGYHTTADPFIVVRVARTDKRARWLRKGGDGYLPMAYGNRREALLAVLAHEMRHLWQANHSRGRVWGSRGRFSERDADAYALRMLRRYRRGELEAE